MFYSSFWSDLDLGDGHQIAQRCGDPCLCRQRGFRDVSLKLPSDLQGYQRDESPVQIILDYQLRRKLLRTIVRVRDVPDQALIDDRLVMHQMNEDLNKVLLSRTFH